MMQRGLIATFVFLLNLTFAVGFTQAGVLTKFDQTRITIEAHPAIKTFGMTKATIEEYVRTWMNRNLPRLAINPSVAPFVHVSVLIQERSGFAYGYVSVRIVRKVTINDTNLVISGGVWQTGGTIISRVPETKDFVFQSLDQLLAKFAGQWSRDNS